MLIYYFVLLLCYWASLLKDKILVFSILSFIAFFLCAGYMTGSDWPVYEELYNYMTFERVLESREEWGYGYLQSFCKFIGIDFWGFHIFFKLLVFVSICYFTNFLKINVALFIAFFLPELGLFLFIDCPFRNLIAMGAFCFSIKYLLERNMWLYFVFVAIATLFHASSLILFPLYFIANAKLRNIIWIILFVFVNFLSYNIDFLVKNIFFHLFNISEFAKDKLMNYFIDDKYLQDKVNIGTIYRIIVFAIIIYYRKGIEDSHKYGRYIFNLSMFFFMLYPIGISIKIFARFSIFTNLFYIATMVLMLYIPKSAQVKSLLFLIFFLWGGLRMYVNITSNSHYIPYTNYFQYIFQEELPYSYRSNYNMQKSPYNNRSNNAGEN